MEACFDPPMNLKKKKIIVIFLSHNWEIWSQNCEK